MNASDFTKYLQRMLAITDTGLTFTKDPFDRERYEDLRILLSEMLNQVSDLDAEEVAEVLKPTSAYATPLMDVRAWIVEDEKVCLVRGKCKLLDGQFQENQEIADLQFFAIDQLPALSEKRITKEQMEILWQVYKGQRDQYVD